MRPAKRDNSAVDALFVTRIANDIEVMKYSVSALYRNFTQARGGFVTLRI